jgi:osmotically inducible lipoprotein OsmB
MRIPGITWLAAALVALAACGDTVGERAATGGLGGAVVGTAVGGPIIGTAAGATAGALTTEVD